MPASEAAPTTKVMAISVGLKVPLTGDAHPNKNDQISDMITSQKIMHGIADHFAQSFF
jgi:hypothetical protein